MGTTNKVCEQSPQRSDQPARGAVAINYSSDQVLDEASRFVLLSTAGTLKVDMVDGTLGVSLILPANVWLPLQITKIYNSGSSNAVGFIYV